MKKNKPFISLEYRLDRYFNRLIIYFVILTCISSGCKKLLDVDSPTTSINSKNIYNSDPTAASVLTGIYTSMVTEGLRGGGINSTTLFPALSSDELLLFGGSATSQKQYIPYFLNSLTNSNSVVTTSKFYSIIYIINSAIEGLNNSSKLTSKVKNQLMGEAKFTRAFYYFYLVNLYGDVPLILTTDYKINTSMPKSPKNDIYQQIIKDLNEAKKQLDDKYLQADIQTPYSLGSEERVRPTKWAATALLARVYLYNGELLDAERESTEVINHSSLFHLTGLSDTFLKNNSETIWALQPVNTTLISNTEDAYLFVLPPSGPSTNGFNSFYLSKRVIDAFESGDLRKTEWIKSATIGSITYYYPFKYKANILNAGLVEYPIVLRLAEQYLIRAEARIKNGNVAGGVSDLNLIRDRASDQSPGALKLSKLSNTLTSEDALKAVMHERQVELFMEWGHRWFDLKRTMQVDEVMEIVTKEKGGSWNRNWQLYPFSLDDLKYNPNLIQNTGY